MRRVSLIDLSGAAGVVAVLALTPMLLNSNYLTGVLTVCAIYAIWAASWDFMSGLTGRENFGHSLFIGAGAYTAGFLATVWFANPWYSLPAAVVVAVAFSVVVGFPTLRLKGPYFALAMLTASAIMQRLCLIFWEYSGGEEGLYGLEPLILSPLHYYWFVLAILVVTVAILTALAHSHWGLLLRAIRGDEATCQAAGINVTFYKIASLMISAAFARARRRALCALPVAGQPAAVLGRAFDYPDHHGLCWRHRLDLRPRHGGDRADAVDRDAARVRRVPALDLHA